MHTRFLERNLVAMSRDVFGSANTRVSGIVADLALNEDRSYAHRLPVLEPLDGHGLRNRLRSRVPALVYPENVSLARHARSAPRWTSTLSAAARVTAFPSGRMSTDPSLPPFGRNA